MPAISINRVLPLLREAKFRKMLIEELGWDRYRGFLTVDVEGISYRLNGLAEKRGVVIFECDASTEPMPPYRIRIGIEAEVRKSIHEHIIIFVSADRQLQIWQWVRREAGRPRATREHQFHSSQTGEALVAKLEQLTFDLSEEADLTVAHVTQRTRAAFDLETVTRQFYERFQQEHTKFLSFIRGFTKTADAEWYASLMLNRLMFVYFIQKRGFIDDDRNYLRNKLRTIQESRGADAFHSFYQYFLLRLFHDGFATPITSRDSSLESLIGRVPYLNGGLFDVHILEKASSNIDIADEAFERLFEFFDSYNWYLDDRPLRRDNEINPDVLGYIFEKYINQKEMGAYYTKEDITAYITGNAIGCSLLDKLEDLDAIKRIRRLIAEQPERYAPPESEARARGQAVVLDNLNSAVSVKHGEPDVSLHEAVTRNLDLIVVVEDAIQEASAEELLQIWETLGTFSVIDPTCGSGAFLFAALRVLEPLLEACITRMAAVVADSETPDKAREAFTSVIGELATHPNQSYYVLKSIVLNNLYGVDIMEEAVEICKLRLFLKLVSSLKTPSDLEPLPDIDFNIRCGNSIVGFATVNDLRESIAGTLDFDDEYGQVLKYCQTVDAEYSQFRARQQINDHHIFKLEKLALKEALEALRERVNSYLLGHLGVQAERAEAWLAENRPFHWFAEFHEILDRGGFDVIVGNPPYTEVPHWLSRQYLTQNYATALERWSRDEDVCVFVFERSLQLLSKTGAFGMVLPLSVSFSTKRTFVKLREQLEARRGCWWFSHYDRIPSALFGNDVRTRCTIVLYCRGGVKNPVGGKDVFVTELRRWTYLERDALFATLRYSRIKVIESAGIPKFGSQAQAKTYENLAKGGLRLGTALRASVSFPALAAMAPRFPKHAVFVGGTAYNWFPVWREIPPTTDAEGRPSLPARTACYVFSSDAEADLVFSLLGSSLGYWWWAVASDGFNLKKWLIERFPLSPNGLTPEARSELSGLGEQLRLELKNHYVFKDNRGRVGNWFMPACSREIRAIDDALVRHVAALSEEVMIDIRSFNARFSTSEVRDAGDD